MFISLVLYVFSFFIFIFSAGCLLMLSLVHFPLFFKVDKIFCRLIILSMGAFPKILGTFPNTGTFIIMMNHSSFLDVFLFPLIPRGPYSGVTAIENFKIPLFSILIHRLNVIPIDRKNKKMAIQGIQKAEDALGRGVHMGILPEGSRTLTGKMGTLKKGGFHMAINSGISIIPVGIVGAFSFKPKNRWWIKPGLIKINIGSPIHHREYAALGIEGLSGLVEQKLKYLSGELSEN